MKSTTAPLKDVGEFLRYFGCSVLALATDCVLFALVLAQGGALQTAATVGFLAGLWVSYGLSVRCVFRRRRRLDTRIEFTIFGAVGVVGLALTQLLLWVQVETLNWHPASAKLVAAGVVFWTNFMLRKAILFNQPQLGGHIKHEV